MNHDIMIGELADKFIDAGYQVRKTWSIHSIDIRGNRFIGFGP